MNRDCTARDIKANGGGTKGSSSPNNQTPRASRKYRKHQCAFHRDAPNRYCSTWKNVKYEFIIDPKCKNGLWINQISQSNSILLEPEKSAKCKKNPF